MANRSDHDDAASAAKDRLLAARAADGDSVAVEQLYDRYEKRLFNYCHRITSNRDDAADATQEAFCNVIARLPGLDTDTLNFAAYLYTAARNACMDLIKQSKRAEATEEIPEDKFAVAPLEADPERALLTGDQQRAAREANSRLPESQRTVLALREVAELSYDDIAAALEMSPNAVAQLISRARLNFFKQLRAEAIAIPPLDEVGQRALELVAARQDGKIGEDDRNWLEQHLAENEASRINAEAVQEAAVLYRGIAPVAVILTLKGATLARAAGLTPGKTGHDLKSHQHDATFVMSASSGDGLATASASSNTARSETARFSRRHRVLTLTTIVLVAGVASLAVVSGLGDSSIIPANSLNSAAGATAETGDGDDSTDGANKKKKTRGTAATVIPLLTGQPFIPATPTPRKKKSGTGGDVQSEGDSDSPGTDPQPQPTPPNPQPDPPSPTPDPTPSTPEPTPPVTQPTPPTTCRKPPCTTRPPKQPPTSPPIG